MVVERFRLVEDLEPTPENQTEKKIRGRPFQRGNPGRPVGAKNKTTRLLEQLMADEAPNLIRKVDRAKGGNAKCLALCVDRLLPRRNGRPVDFTLPAVTDTHDVVTAMAAITTALNNGDVTAEEAGQLVNVLNAYVNVLEKYDLACRLEALESEMKKRL